MENLTSQLSPRSLDESGRPPTAGRSSLNRPSVAEFGGHLERARSKVRDASETKGVQENSERDLAEERRVEEGRDDRTESTESSERDEETREDGDRSESNEQTDVASEEGSVSAGESETLEEDVAQAGLPIAPPVPVATPTAEGTKPAGGESKAAAPKDGAATPAAPTAPAGKPPVEDAAPRQATPVTIQGEAPAAPQVETQRAGAGRVSAPAAPQPTGPDPELMARAESILSQVKLRFSPGLRSATMNLNPAELGRIRIEIKVVAGGIRAEMRVETPEALAALERQLPELKTMFAQDGLELTEFDLGLASQGAFDQEAGSDANQESGSGDDSGAPEPASEQLEHLTQALADSAGLDLIA